MHCTDRPSITDRQSSLLLTILCQLKNHRLKTSTTIYVKLLEAWHRRSISNQSFDRRPAIGHRPSAIHPRQMIFFSIAYLVSAAFERRFIFSMIRARYVLTVVLLSDSWLAISETDFPAASNLNTSNSRSDNSS